ncbi:MAG: hypothetical protein DHS20C01_23020 [marine bacterium B5-7]|nr:MAG: hypothetical protein DHS20C01_23020 [marine bacterium B5-7]
MRARLTRRLNRYAELKRLLLYLSIAAWAASSVTHAEDRDLDVQLHKAFVAGELPGLHSVLVLHKGNIIAESYFKGEDERWGRPTGLRHHGPDTLHDLRSVTKPVVGLLYGIALSEGKVPALDENLIAQFPQYADLADGSERQNILVRDALSMKMGTEWNEDLPYTDPNNSEIAMEYAEDRYRFILDRPMVSTPGEQWTYNGGAVAIVARLIADGVGMPIDKYAQEKLFKPLGITEFEWIHGSNDVPSAASGLRLNTHDLAKIGQLVLNNGLYDGKQIVPASWLTASFEPQATLKDGLRYGLLWWLSPQGSPPSWVAGFGNGGQRLTVNPGDKIILVIFAGNYNQPNDWQLPVKIIEEFLVPALFPE